METSGSGSRTPLRIGFVYVADYNQFQAQFGASGGTADGDQKAMIEALVTDTNARGGIAGRRLDPYFFGVHATDTDPRDQVEQQACAQFTQDDRVSVAVIPAYFRTLRTCLARAGVVGIGEGSSNSVSQTFRELAGYFEPGSIDLERQAAAFAAALKRQGYFSGWSPSLGRAGADPVKVGVVTYDIPTYRYAVDRVLKRGLEAVGHPALDVAYLSYTDTGNAVASASNAVLRFRATGISHVLFVSEGGTFGLIFMEQARSQGYYPRYGYTSQTLPQMLIGGGYAADPDRSFNGAKGIGWWPILDLPPGDPGAKGGAAFARCMFVAKRAGVGLPSTFAQFNMAKYCDAVWFLEEAVTAAEGSVSIAAVTEGARRIGADYGSPIAAGASFASPRSSGVTAVFDYYYRNACKCWSYDGRPHFLA